MMLGKTSKAFSSGEGGGGGVELNLTALMDILSNLLFFLLASYTAQAIEVQQKKDLSLPASSSQAKLQKDLVVTVTRSQIQVASVPVCRIEAGKLVGTTVEEEKVVALYDKLRSLRSSRQAGAGDAGDTILLLADRSTDAALVSKVLKTAGMAGFPNVRFGVVSQ
jgi:biopolymer transport protein ExbD